MSRDAVVQFRALCLRQGQRISFQSLPDDVQQFRFFRSGEAVYLIS